ncbi:hypothetical protein [Nocardia sp. BMG51109]|nr:hypothetical protein [Nocardia sp. BMG51109]
MSSTPIAAPSLDCMISSIPYNILDAVAAGGALVHGHVLRVDR